MPDEEGNNDASPQPAKDGSDKKEPIPDFGTPLKTPKSDNVVEKNDEDD